MSIGKLRFGSASKSHLNYFASVDDIEYRGGLRVS